MIMKTWRQERYYWRLAKAKFRESISKISWMGWHKFVIQATWEVKAGGLIF
jgi:hypothetical protein